MTRLRLGTSAIVCRSVPVLEVSRGEVHSSGWGRPIATPTAGCLARHSGRVRYPSQTASERGPGLTRLLTSNSPLATSLSLREDLEECRRTFYEVRSRHQTHDFREESPVVAGGVSGRQDLLPHFLASPLGKPDYPSPTLRLARPQISRHQSLKSLWTCMVPLLAARR